jgi:hypothetical protein
MLAIVILANSISVKFLKLFTYNDVHDYQLLQFQSQQFLGILFKDAFIAAITRKFMAN